MALACLTVQDLSTAFGSKFRTASQLGLKEQGELPEIDALERKRVQLALHVREGTTYLHSALHNVFKAFDTHLCFAQEIC